MYLLFIGVRLHGVSVRFAGGMKLIRCSGGGGGRSFVPGNRPDRTTKKDGDGSTCPEEEENKKKPVARQKPHGIGSKTP